ncbi:DNA polymerase beta-like region [Dissulfurispira thermophila]|uniref:DNA polymerase beta-like region n=2 Tax=root TaxID=1 RepID=A0A7G1GZY9_9BACT|nr:nucleotidyltransferase domain-containing protein [Dissulfurispira thermophila]BCB96060.1 DNA polymerase beta-like region [Dissulfurispira thermophila]
MVKTAQEIKEIVERYAAELEKIGIRPQRVILYGSYAKGQAREDSDIDLIVISEDFKGRNLRERLEILGLAAGRVFEPIEARGYTEEEIIAKEDGSFLDEVVTEGLAVAL